MRNVRVRIKRDPGAAVASVVRWCPNSPNGLRRRRRHIDGDSAAAVAGRSLRPGVRKYDVGMLVWDMPDAKPFAYDVIWTGVRRDRAYGLGATPLPDRHMRRIAAC